MNPKNLFIVGWVITAIAASFLILEYYTLSPFMFIGGLVFAAFVGLWRANRMKTKDLIVLIGFSIVIALIDEYAHTSSGVLIYFDLGIPSLLTVMGWSLFILLILTGTEILARTTFLRQIDKWEAKIQSGIMRKAIRALPALIAIVMIVVLAYLQLYIDLFSPLLIGVYIALAIGSLYYSHLKSIGWNLSILVVSVVVGLVMELLGGIEGMWWYYYLEPMAWFMMFTWALRTWTILTCCSFLRVRFEEVL